MSISRWYWVFFIGYCWVLLSAHAVTVEGLYESQTVVTGQGPEDRQRGFRLTLVDVLIKLSGDSTLADSDNAKALLDRAQDFVQTFRYEPRIKTQIHDEQGTRDRPFILHVTFNAPALEQAMGAADIRIWGAERPRTLVWLAVKDMDMTSRYVLGDSGENGRSQREVLVSLAEKRGIPIQLPAMDQQDQEAIGYADINSESLERIGEASTRYGAEAVLSGNLVYEGPASWSMTWVLQQGDLISRWYIAGVTFDIALAAGIDGLAERLAAQSANATPRERVL